MRINYEKLSALKLRRSVHNYAADSRRPGGNFQLIQQRRYNSQDLHRTGCSLFCGAAGRDNQAVLRRVLLGFARWNKSVGYCQGLNVLAALVLQVMDRAESSAVKVMIYLIEGVLPEGYFADNLRGLSVDMAVFRDLLRSRLPKLSKHLEALQSDAKDKATGELD